MSDKSIRTYIDVPVDLFADVEVFKKTKRCPTRAEALRRLVDAGIEQFRMQNPAAFDIAKQAMTVLLVVSCSVSFLWLGGEDLKDRQRSEMHYQTLTNP